MERVAAVHLLLNVKVYEPVGLHFNILIKLYIDLMGLLNVVLDDCGNGLVAAAYVQRVQYSIALSLLAFGIVRRASLD